jgi:hypothetical protein
MGNGPRNGMGGSRLGQTHPCHEAMNLAVEDNPENDAQGREHTEVDRVDVVETETLLKRGEEEPADKRCPRGASPARQTDSAYDGARNGNELEPSPEEGLNCAHSRGKEHAGDARQ